MIAYWPGRIQPGQVSEHLSYFPDFFPTYAELAGAKTPSDVDGISMVPTLLGAQAAGRAQRAHDYLYWELGGQCAVRQGSWKAVRTRKAGAWALYDLATDVSEAKDVAAQNEAVLERLKKLAVAAHTPAVPGSFGDRSLHDRDRRARGARRRGKGRGQRKGRRGRAGGEVQRLPTKGVYARDGWSVVRVSSEHAAGEKLGSAILDGDPRTHWHTRFGAERASHPHEIVIDMKESRDVAGIVCLARQDGGWNGAFGRCEVHVGDDTATLREREANAVTFRKLRTPQRAHFAKTQRGRYLLVRVLSEAGGGPWASLSELGVLKRAR